MVLTAHFHYAMSGHHATLLRGTVEAMLPTEAELDRAAYATPDGAERPDPWGEAPVTGARASADGVGVQLDAADLEGEGWVAPVAGLSAH